MSTIEETPAIDPAKLTHICTINWNHGKPSNGVIASKGILIGFDKPVTRVDLHDQSVRLQFEQRSDHDPQAMCLCQLPGRFRYGNLNPSCDASSPFTSSGAATVNAVMFLPDTWPKGRYRVVIIGDYIEGDGGLAVDGNHLPG